MINKQMEKIKTLQQAIQYFSNEKVCVEFISRVKWGGEGKPFCPKCGSDNVIGLSTRPVFKCREKGCKKQFSIKAGTIFDNSPLPLSKLLPALWLVCNAKNGISSCELSRALGIHQSSAWHLLHRCREAMRTGTFQKLKGKVELDATFIGGLEKFKHKDKKTPSSFKKYVRGGAGKTPVFAMLERGGEARAMVVAGEGEKSVEPIIKSHVEEGTKLLTDAHSAYAIVSHRNNFEHESVEHSVQEYVRGEVHTNGLENFFTLFKRAVKGTYTHIAPFHVDRYLDEQTFRYNNRKTRDFDRFEQAVSQMFERKLTYATLTGKVS